MQNNHAQSIQELEQLKIELEMKQNYFGAFTTSVLSNDLREHFEDQKEQTCRD
ncbi:hypothetical protein JZO70_13530 [Enterococcus sp. 669A]|uniref:Uncharacterized protein n=1 Tax=Candidatus Enterococcus moelleringii TaxID=2815325 RepID=A0ABS3LC31_9ENTE|nr:hypothetical protein [Enterococcus sp. 669A]MBO1307193.1 hypothetical protein [Enterococcus sp. 669A]